jgi:hypothetical protein
MPASTGPDDRPALDIDRGEGDVPAMNRPGPRAADDREVIPGNLGWDEPSDEEPQALEGAVRRAGKEQGGEPASLPGDATSKKSN